MSLDERLRATMAAHGASVAATYDPLDAVIEGGGYRRRRAIVIRLAVTLAAIVALTAAVPIVGSPRSAPAEPTGVPWLDQPVKGFTPSPAGSYTCRPSDLEITESRGVGLAHYVVNARNVSASSCFVDGRPVVESRRPDGTVAIPTSEPPDSADAVRQQQAYLTPGRAAVAYIGVPAGCVTNGWPTSYDNVFAVFGGRSFHLDDQITSGCGLLTSIFVDPHLGAEYVMSRRPPVAVAGIRAPSTVHAGQILDFKVVIRNIARTPAVLVPMVYAMSFASDARGYQLNCAGITIPAGGTQWFDMRIAVPADLAPGSYALTWWLSHYPAPEVVAVDVQP